MVSGKVFFALVAFFLCVAVADVVVLTSENFDSFVDGSKGAFVEFYAPWCGHCKKLAPDYEKLGETFAKDSDKVVIGKVDCTVEQSVCTRYGVSGYPTLKYFPVGSTEPKDYQSGRDLDSLVSYISRETGVKARVKKAVSAVVDLTPANFDSVVGKNKHVLVEFFAPWCGHCKSLAPIYDQLGALLAGEKNVVIAKVDADKFSALGGRYGVTGFPTLKWFPAGSSAAEDYESGRDLASFIEFINEHAGTERLPNGDLMPTAGRIPHLDELAASFWSAADKSAIVQKAKDAIANLSEELSTNGKVYRKAFETALAEGKAWLDKEVDRLSRMIENADSLAASKLDEFRKRLNILRSFN